MDGEMVIWLVRIKTQCHHHMAICKKPVKNQEWNWRAYSDTILDRGNCNHNLLTSWAHNIMKCYIYILFDVNKWWLIPFVDCLPFNKMYTCTLQMSIKSPLPFAYGSTHSCSVYLQDILIINSWLYTTQPLQLTGLCTLIPYTMLWTCGIL